MSVQNILAELLYILARYVKGSLRVSGMWGSKYSIKLKGIVETMQVFVEFICAPERVDWEEILSFERRVRAYVGNEFFTQEITLYKADQRDEVEKVEKVEKLMSEIISEVLYILDRKGKKYKKKIFYLLSAFHNLPRVYFSKERRMYNTMVERIDVEEAVNSANIYLRTKDTL